MASGVEEGWLEISALEIASSEKRHGGAGDLIKVACVLVKLPLEIESNDSTPHDESNNLQKLRL